MRISPKIIIIGVFLGIIPWIEGCSPLHDAAYEGNVEKLQTSIEKGADVDSKDIDDLAPLHHAAWKGDKECVELLLAKGAAVDSRGGKDLHGVVGMLAPLPAYILASARNETPLHVAAEEGHLEIVKVLIDHGADINAKNYHGETPLMLAFRHLDDPVTEYVTSGFPTGTKWFMKHQSEETIKLLLERGADVNVTSKSPGQVTPLHQAVYRGNKELTKLILDRGGNINAPDHVGDTPLHYAVRGSLVRTGSKFKIETDKELVKLLLDRGADVNAQGFWKETPLKIAKNKEIKELLQQYGAK